HRYSLTNSGGLWGASFSSTAATSVSLTGVNFFGVNDALNQGLFVAKDYVFGTAISGTVTWNNKTLADLGITNLGTYVYTAGSGANTDTVTVIFSSGGGGGSGAVPEPTSMAIFGLGALGFAYRNRRRIGA
ncbi:MAG: motif, partial [Planctomycetota bacterium]